MGWTAVMNDVLFDLFKLVLACVVLGGFGYFVSLCMASDRERQERIAEAKRKRNERRKR